MLKSYSISLLMSFFLVSCISTPAFSPLSDSPTVTPHTKDNSIYIGLSEEEAIQKAKLRKERFRIVERDGKPMIITKDYIVGRINATSESGVIKSVRVE